MFTYYEVINGQLGDNNLTPMDKIKIAEYEVARSEEIIKSLEEKLDIAKKNLVDKKDEANSLKAEAKTYLKDLLKEIK